MAGRHRSDNEHDRAANKPKRAQRIETGETGTHPIHSSHRAAIDAGDPPLTAKHGGEPTEQEPEVDATSERVSLGIAESAARDRGESVPTTPYSRGQG